jgi:hypothetical protein
VAPQVMAIPSADVARDVGLDHSQAQNSLAAFKAKGGLQAPECPRDPAPPLAAGPGGASNRRPHPLYDKDITKRQKNTELS